MTAAVRPYDNLLASHADGSGKVSTNHSWKTGGYLLLFKMSGYNTIVVRLPWQNLSGKNLSCLVVLRSSNSIEDQRQVGVLDL